MGVPITWQNIIQGDASTAWRAMDSAQKSFSSAFEGLGGVLKEREAIDAGNQAVQSKNNTNSYLNQVAQLGNTPEALQKAIADGSLAALRNSFGPNIDHAATRNAATDLLDQRYKQAQAATEYGHAIADERSHPFMEAYKVAALKGDKAGMATADAAYTAAGGRDLAGLVTFADMRNQETILRDRATTKFGFDSANQADNLLNTANQRRTAMINAESQRTQAGASVESAHASTENARTSKASLIGGLQDKAEERQLKASAGLGTISSHLASSPDGAKVIADTIAKIPDESGRRNAARIAASLPRDALASDVAQAVSTINQRSWRSNAHIDSEVLDVFTPLYEASKKDRGTKDIVDARKALYSSSAARAVQDSNTMRQLLINALPGAVGGIDTSGIDPEKTAKQTAAIRAILKQGR